MNDKKQAQLNVLAVALGNIIGILLKLTILYFYPIYLYCTTGNLGGALTIALGIFINLILINLVMVHQIHHHDLIKDYMIAKMFKR